MEHAAEVTTCAVTPQSLAEQAANTTVSNLFPVASSSFMKRVADMRSQVMRKQSAALTLPKASRGAPSMSAAPNSVFAARHPSSVYGRTLVIPITRPVQPNMVVVVA
jgi:hypothetical protein